jgi:hypothetical protein
MAVVSRTNGRVPVGGEDGITPSASARLIPPRTIGVECLRHHLVPRSKAIRRRQLEVPSTWKAGVSPGLFLDAIYVAPASLGFAG